MASGGHGSLRLAIVGATGAVGGQLLELIDERAFPFSQLKLFSSEEHVGESIESGEQTRPVEVLTDPSELSDSDLVFLAVQRSEAEAILGTAAGPIVVDLSAASQAPAGTPFVAPGFTTREAVRDLSRYKLFHTPHPALGQRGNSRQKLRRQRLHRHNKISLLRRLRHIVRSPATQRLQRRSRTMLGVRAAHDHGQSWILYPQPVQYLKPIHLRHLKIQHQNIRMKLSHQLQALDTIPRDPAQLHPRQLALPVLRVHQKQLQQHAPHHGRVIRGKNTKWPSLRDLHI